MKYTRRDVLQQLAMIGLGGFCIPPGGTAMTDQCAVNTDETVSKYHQIGYVVVTPEGPDDGGDFGPNTPGTRTAGIQEALNYALNFGTPKNWSPRAGKNLYSRFPR